MNLRCLKLYRAYSISFNYSNAGKVFWSWILKDCIKVQKRKTESCCLLFPSSTKRELGPFHVIVVQRRQRNVQKGVMHVQSCCFADLNLLLFCLSRCRRRRRCINSLVFFHFRTGFRFVHSLYHHQWTKLAVCCAVDPVLLLICLVNQISHTARPIRSPAQIWVVTRHQYGISTLVSQTSFRGETVSGVVKYRLFSQATLASQIAHFTVTVGNEAGVDLVLIQPRLLYYVNHVFVILNSIF